MAMLDFLRLRLGAAALIVGALAAGCGGGGGSPGQCLSGSPETCAAASSGSSTSAAPASTPTSASYAGVCTLDGEKQFTRAYLNEVYLWYAEMPPSSPALFNSVPDYFYSLLTPQRDANGQYKDRFSFIATNTDADSLTTGENVGYGVRWEQDAQGRTRVAFVDAGSPAHLAGLQRGGELVQTLTGSPDWYPNAAAGISFVYRSTPADATRTVVLATAPVQEDPVPLATTMTSSSGRRVAYLLFNAHTLGAQDKLIAAIQGVQAAGVQDVVLDLRYNGGGYLYTAQTLSSMLAGPVADGQVFERLRFNDKRQSLTDESAYFFSPQVQYGETVYPVGAALPRLGLPRLYVLTSDGTCSASETVINGLRGVGVDVAIIGKTTCGKPYGFSRKSNCGYAYFPIEFQGVNAQGFGDYAAGFSPTCEVADDFDHALGSGSERLLSAALYHMDSGTCPSQPMAAPLAAPRNALAIQRPPLRGKLLRTRQ